MIIQVYLINYILKAGLPPPAPFPLPGSDPTADTLDCAAEYVAVTSSVFDSLIIPYVSEPGGQTIAVPIIIRNSKALLGYQIYLEFDPNILTLVGLDMTATATGDANPDFFFSYDSLGQLSISCTIDCDHLLTIPAGRDTLIKIVFHVSDHCTTSALDLKTLSTLPFLGNLLHYGTGNVYPVVVDSGFSSWTESGVITSTTDVGNDQGRQVRVEWAGSCYDDAGSPFTITEYGLWRRIDQYLATDSKDNPYSRTAYPPGDWDFVKTVPARGETTYNSICPTLADSTEAEGMYWSVFFVSAMTSDPLVYFDSEPDSGYSLDNIPPMPIANLELQGKDSTHLFLDWTVPGEYPGEEAIFGYEIRYHTIPLDTDPVAWWNDATSCSGEEFFNFSVAERDSFQAFVDTIGVTPYYFAIKAKDLRPNFSLISNVPPKFMCGDVDDNCDVGLADAVYLINYVLKSGPAPKPYLFVGDVTPPEAVDIVDVVYLINYLFRGGPPPCTP